VFLLAASVVGRSEYKRYLAKQGMTSQEFRDLLKLKLNEAGSKVLLKFITSLIIAFLISMVSFRELWVNDVFHVVFLTMLLARPIHKQLRKMFE
jgi:hypothetical protein